MRFKKTEKAKWTIVYHEGKRIAEFVNNEFETDDKDIIRVLKSMGYQDIGKLGNTVMSVLGDNAGPSVSDLLGKATKVTGEVVEPIRRKPGRPPANKPLADVSEMV